MNFFSRQEIIFPRFWFQLKVWYEIEDYSGKSYICCDTDKPPAWVINQNNAKKNFSKFWTLIATGMNSMTVLLETDSDENFDGFRLEWDVWGYNECEIGTHKAIGLIEWF